MSNNTLKHWKQKTMTENLKCYVLYYITDSDYDKQYGQENLETLLAHPRLGDVSDVIIAMHKADVSLGGCGCCESPYFYFSDDPDDNISDVTYDAEINEGFIGDVKFKVVINNA